MDRSQVARWLEGYVRAWETNDPDDIKALFTEDAEYRTEPFAAPWRGHDDIVTSWIDRKDGPGWGFEPGEITVCGDISFAEAVTYYPDRTYSNLWVLRLNGDGRCSSYTEWWVLRP